MRGESLLAAKITIGTATEEQRKQIYRARHQIYALELRQHAANNQAELSDPLDGFNTFLTASVGECLAGFISVTPPGGPSYSVDKYFAREELPFEFDNGLYEVRLLSVLPGFRRLAVASLLMYAALRWVESRGGTRIVAIGRTEVLKLYKRAGMISLGRQVKSGAVTYELLSAPVEALHENLENFARLTGWLERKVNWQLEFPYRVPAACYHGGVSFSAIGEEFDSLERSHNVISADVLDAWFPPSPNVLAALNEYLPWITRTSPPTGCEGMIRTIARVRNVPAECIVPAARSSSLIFMALREWLTRDSRVLLLDPSYGEYAHVAERIIGCRVDRLPLERMNNYAVISEVLERQLADSYDVVVLVNPNSPTGQHVPRRTLEALLARVPSRTRVWVDETYVEYVGEGESLEEFAAKSKSVLVCKSMSKVYALSGLRAAYLVAPLPLARALREITPPWAVSLPSQIAAVKALEDPRYYEVRYLETHALRNQLADSLRALGMDVVPGVANFLLCHLPPECADAATVCDRARGHGLFVRDAGKMSARLGSRALRVAVKDGHSNSRMVAILAEAMRAAGNIQARAASA